MARPRPDEIDKKAAAEGRRKAAGVALEHPGLA
jgi:hypothetical protein